MPSDHEFFDGQPTNPSSSSLKLSNKLIGHVLELNRDPIQAKTLLLSCKFFGRKIDFLIESGVERSLTFSGAGGEQIPSYGQISGKVAIPGLRREFPLTFIVANTPSILGADFLTSHGLSLNMKERTLMQSWKATYRTESTSG